MGYYGINSFSYSLILPYKKRVRNQLILFKRGAEAGEKINVDSDALAQLFLIDADNIDGEFYTEEDLLIVNPILDAYYSGENMYIELSADDAEVFIDLAMKRRLTLEQNEKLAVKLAEHYNKTTNNELLLIRIDHFREVCRSIDTPAQ
ncbi:MAG: hypothetical protein IJ017_06860 [Oscillospiraceae bacterium]|nr:hypothetical protein [Oscillospiraceae bacterium]